MKLTSKNIIIILIILFFIFNHIIGLAWNIVKTILYCALFMLLLSQISPELYNYIVGILNAKDFKVSSIFNIFIGIFGKIKNYIPFISEKCKAIVKKVSKNQQEEEEEES